MSPKPDVSYAHAVSYAAKRGWEDGVTLHAFCHFGDDTADLAALGTARVFDVNFHHQARKFRAFVWVDMKQHYAILSLGCGVQSSTLVELAIQGILPKPDYAIFADPMWEGQLVYKHLWWLVERADKAGIPVLTWSKGNIKDDMMRSMVRGRVAGGERWASMPFFTKDRISGSVGMIRRQCTKEYKIDVLTGVIRNYLLGLRKGQRFPADVHVTQWIGISIDEKHRMRLSDRRWQTNEYPLIGWPTQYLEKRWTRQMCKDWFASIHPGYELPKSACIGCPFHSNDEWRDMKHRRPEEWEEAVAFDKAIRTMGGTRGDVFLHASCVPLDEVDLSKPTEVSLGLECMGMCGS